MMKTVTYDTDEYALVPIKGLDSSIIESIAESLEDTDTKDSFWKRVAQEHHSALIELTRVHRLSGVDIDYRMAKQILDAFGGEPGVITISADEGHSGTGVYFWYTEYPEEGSEYLGEVDDEALPEEEQKWVNRANELLTVFESVDPDEHSNKTVLPWVQAVDYELVGAHIAVANESDTFQEARSKLNSLINWHIAVATDPAVNGGYQLVKVEQTS